MDRIFFEKLHLPEPRFNLEIGSGSHGLQTGRMIIEIEKILVKEAPDVVLVQGDTNTVLAGAIAASKMGIKIGHVEAGLRSYDNTMPEEVNRRLADHCSDYLFAPTEKSKGILVNEGISLAKIFVTGNTIVDAVYQNLKIANNSGNILEDLGLEEKKYFLVTAHRQENVDNLENLKEIMKGLKRVSEKFGLPIIFPIHPRTKKNMEEFKIKFDFLTLIEPVDFLDFLKLESKAKLILTDSGGVQEESCILGVPCVTMRENTERPETIEVGSNLLAGIDESRILDSVECMLNKEAKWTNPFGDGKAAERIIKILNGAENERKLT